MARFHGTSEGNVPFTPQEETERDAEEQAWKDGARARAMASLRAKRDRLLAESDRTQLEDAPLTAGEKAAWAGYRRELRDLPATAADPEKPVWPSTPA